MQVKTFSELTLEANWCCSWIYWKITFSRSNKLPISSGHDLIACTGVLLRAVMRRLIGHRGQPFWLGSAKNVSKLLIKAGFSDRVHRKETFTRTIRKMTCFLCRSTSSMNLVSSVLWLDWMHWIDDSSIGAVKDLIFISGPLTVTVDDTVYNIIL